tara:strand:- start:94 stop:477 length:384 start_codon:yes stop_codon:yes gene_type:complete
MNPHKDKLETLFKLRSSFMKELEAQKPGSYPAWPISITEKKSQQLLRDTALKGIEEMFEALQHLKNWKPHRDTVVDDFNHDEFLEEVVDAFNYFLSMLVLVGVNEEDFFKAYLEKDKIIRDRLLSGY